jgi:hypothetical protein
MLENGKIDEKQKSEYLKNLNEPEKMLKNNILLRFLVSFIKGEHI